jgi:hypothetical protein
MVAVGQRGVLCMLCCSLVTVEFLELHIGNVAIEIKMKALKGRMFLVLTSHGFLDVFYEVVARNNTDGK